MKSLFYIVCICALSTWSYAMESPEKPYKDQVKEMAIDDLEASWVKLNEALDDKKVSYKELEKKYANLKSEHLKAREFLSFVSNQNVSLNETIEKQKKLIYHHMCFQVVVLGGGIAVGWGLNWYF